ncbi:MAG TPA: outer membrane protein assembly factor BamD [Gemmatimonadaceae bacterium]
MLLSRRALAATLLLVAAACHPDFEIAKFPTNQALYRAAMDEFNHGRWDNAVAAFEKLTTDLSARDTLLPRAHWYLARAHQERGEWVLAATSFSRLTESFPDDTLAPAASLEGARSYRKLWRKPTLDPTYGESALATYNTLLSLYPQSPQAEIAKKELAELQEMFAQKNYLAGMYYFRRGGYDSGIIYFKDVLTRYPAAPTARLAQLRLVDAYKAIRYREDAADACATLRKSYPNDADVQRSCDGIPQPSAPIASTPANAPPSSTGPPVPPTTQASAPPASPTP